MKLRIAYLLLCMVAFGAGSESFAQNMRQPVVSRGGAPAQTEAYQSGLPEPLKAVSIVQNVGHQLPLGLKFTDDLGKEVELGTYFKDRPVVFAFAYYTCPMLCGQVLQGITGSLKALTFDVGKEYDVVVVSFNPRDSFQQAAKSKRTYLHRYGREHTKDGWHFLTGEQAAIDSLTRVAGFHYQWDSIGKQYAHGSMMLVVTPEGKLSRYFYGIEFPPKDVKYALMEAANYNIGSVIDQVMLYCFHYDPSRGKQGAYVVSLLRMGAGATLLGLGCFFVAMRRRSKREKASLIASKLPLAPEQLN